MRHKHFRWKMRNAHYKTWNVAKKNEKRGKLTKTLFDLEHGKKH